MEIFAIALMFFSTVILIVSLVYIISNNSSKEKLAMIEKGLDPEENERKKFHVNSLKLGMLAFAVGLGFITAFYIDEYIVIEIDNPAIYPGCIFIYAGLSLIIYHAIKK